MPRFSRIATAAIRFGIAATFALISAGCGDNAKVAPINESPEAKAADTGGQKAMQDYMTSKKAGGAQPKGVAPR